MKNIIPQAKALDFITAGKATFTALSVKTQKRFTYKVSAPKGEENPKILFVSVLTGSDNTTNYSYVGFLRKENNWLFNHGKASHLTPEAPSVKAIGFVMGLLVNHLETPNLELWHEGKCCRCGRTLTVPESIQSGIGPECAKKF
jgi:hypothetical protein